MPLVRLLLTHVIPDEQVRHEAGVITLLLDERPTLAFELLTPVYVSSRAPLRVILLEVGVETLAASLVASILITLDRACTLKAMCIIPHALTITIVVMYRAIVIKL